MILKYLMLMAANLMTISAAAQSFGANYTSINTFILTSTYKNIDLSIGSNFIYKYPKVNNADEVLSWEQDATTIQHVTVGYLLQPSECSSWTITPIVGVYNSYDNYRSCDNMFEKRNNNIEGLIGLKSSIELIPHINLNVGITNKYMVIGLSYSINKFRKLWSCRKRSKGC